MGEVVFQEDSENAIDLKASTYKSEQKQKEDDWSRFSIPVVMAADQIKQFEVDEKFEYAYDEHYDQQAAQESWDLPVFKEIESDKHPVIINTSY